jgi:predicted  nucleic acid-binding Zn-ribbon protein
MKKEVKTVRLRRLEQNLALIQKSENYLEDELRKIREKEAYIRDKISKEKKAISLISRAKKLR